MLKLFRDYVFHQACSAHYHILTSVTQRSATKGVCIAPQVNEEGKPVLDLAHVIECLNKLEVGSAEKVLLVRNCYFSFLCVDMWLAGSKFTLDLPSIGNCDTLHDVACALRCAAGVTRQQVADDRPLF